MATLEATPHFRRALARLSGEQRAGVARAMRRLRDEPRDPRLHTHKLDGEPWACSYAYDGRFVFTWAGNVITLHDVGTHDEVY